MTSGSTTSATNVAPGIYLWTVTASSSVNAYHGSPSEHPRLTRQKPRPFACSAPRVSRVLGTPREGYDPLCEYRRRIVGRVR